MIPGVMETLRIEGEGTIALDDSILDLGAINGRRPPAALIVKVTKVYAHCGKSMIRSHLWDPDRHVERGSLPTLGEMIQDQAELGVKKAEADELVAHEYQENLY